MTATTAIEARRALLRRARARRARRARGELRRVAVVGETAGGDAPLLPIPGSSGARLARMLGVPDVADVADVGDLDDMRTIDRPLRDYDLVVCLGLRVARELIGRRAALWERVGGCWCFPHPSGRSRYWNDARARREAARRLREEVGRWLE